MSKNFAELIEVAEQAVQQHNGSVEDSQQIDFDAFKASLARIGGTTVEALKEVSWEDLEELGEVAVPRLLAKRLATIFRQEDNGSKRPKKGVGRVTAKSAPDDSAEKLVKAYDPRRPTSPAAKELKARTGDRPCVLFDDDGGVHRKITALLVKELEDNEPPRRDYVLGGKPRRLFRIGELPDETTDEHPLFPGVRLRRDGTCDLGLNWKALKKPVRILLHLAANKTGELRLSPDDVDRVHDIYARASASDAEQSLRLRYREASKLYDELEGRNELPSLKLEKTNDRLLHGGGGHPFHQSPHRQH